MPDPSPTHVDAATLGHRDDEPSTPPSIDASTIVIGRVVDEFGAPIAGAEVHVRPIVDGETHEQSNATTYTTVDGAFEARCQGSGPALVVATKANCTPDGADVDLIVGVPASVRDLRLSPGCAITGIVRRTNGERLPGVRVEAFLESALAAIDVGYEVQWVDGRWRRSDADAMTDADGRFEIGGLEPATHRIVVFENLGRSGTAWMDEERDVIAPATGVECIVSDFSQLVIEVTGPDGPIAAAEVIVQGEAAGIGGATGTDGRFQCPVIAGENYHVCAESPLYAGTTVDVVAPPPGEEKVVTISLSGESSSARPSLMVFVAGSDSDAFDDARLERTRDDSRFPNWTTGCTAEEGGFPFGRSIPGRYRLFVTPNAEACARNRCVAPLDIEIPADDDEHVVTVETRLGGRIRLAVRDSVGRALSGEVRILDDAGESMGEVGVPGPPPPRGSLRPSATSEWLVPSGSYTVECSAIGHVTKTVGATVVAGETTNVDVTLERE
ncbi:MAG: carboxypeptidase regulatory-like domain-containing protein [Planctomycetes bacterium]|nr:carboxypeptidase regulatory-like domain-containing protein [Planctomycetota bacterium]